jgi:hypothetical protein
MSLSPKKHEKGIINDEVEKNARGVHVLHEILAIYSTSSKGIRYPRFLLFVVGSLDSDLGEHLLFGAVSISYSTVVILQLSITVVIVLFH